MRKIGGHFVGYPQVVFARKMNAIGGIAKTKPALKMKGFKDFFVVLPGRPRANKLKLIGSNIKYFYHVLQNIPGLKNGG